MTTVDETKPDVVAVGLLEDPFITRGPWVVHPYWDSLPPGSGVPFYDTPCKPAPVQKSCDRPASSPLRSPFTAGRAAITPRFGREQNRVADPILRCLRVVPWSLTIAIAGALLVEVARRVTSPPSVVGVLAVAVAVVCGLLLVVAAHMGRRGSR